MDGGFTKLFKLCIFKILQTNPRLGKMRYKTILPSRFFFTTWQGRSKQSSPEVFRQLASDHGGPRFR